MARVFPPNVETIIALAVEEDLGRGDVTTRLTVPQGARSRGRAIARSRLVMSGGDVFEAVMRKVDPGIRVEHAKADGERAAAGDVLLAAEGPTDSLLMAERVALNFVQRLCGVATLTRAFVDALPQGSPTRIADTRKTTPGMRFLEREAVRHGGGCNHRVDLSGGILIKENHAAAAGSVGEAVRLCRAGAPHPLRVEVEVRSFAELEEALAAGADAVLLDNMAPREIARCAQRARGKALVEASGGVTLSNVGAIAAAGVDVISVGGLTHSAPAADVSFLLDAVPPLP
ncbi:MAG: carboxylating nicotinate-nucleotide diphosphorylase [Deltaproteobacteria bacterium]|nr:carboxylating nicotinate-nucleotide diphosphorylase [Deltaproteobacteria bacterium]